MIKFIRNYDIHNIGKKLELIYVGILINLFLNIIFINVINKLRLTLIFTGGINRNYIMFILLNGVVPGILIYVLFTRIKKSNSHTLKTCNLLINLTMLFSLLPLGLNLYNLFLLI